MNSIAKLGCSFSHINIRIKNTFATILITVIYMLRNHVLSIQAFRDYM